jgi:hypothetical protein
MLLGGTSRTTSFLGARGADAARGGVPPGPLWRTDLRPLGLTRDAGTRGCSTVSAGFENLGFAGDGLLLVGFVTSEGAPRASRVRVHVVLLDTATGAAVGAREWSAVRGRAGVSATHGGRFLVRTDERPPDEQLRPDLRITLYSQKFEVLKDLPLPLQRRPAPERWQVLVTASRRSVIVEHQLGRALDIGWLDPDSLRARASWSSPVWLTLGSLNFLSVSDDRLLATYNRLEAVGGAPPADVPLGEGRVPGQPRTCKVAVIDPAGSWTIILRFEGFCFHPAVFVNSRTLVVSPPNRLVVMDTGGRVLVEDAFRGHEFADTLCARGSADGRRFAIPVGVTEGGSLDLDISGHTVFKRILVYELDPARCIYTLDAGHAGLKRIAGLALSPDGSVLALLQDGFVELYRLPGREAPLDH